MSAANGSASGAPAPRTAEAERLLRSLHGVLLARIVTDRDGRILAVHLVGDDDATPGRLVRDAQSALLARYGVYVPLDRIHLTRIPGRPTNGRPTNGRPDENGRHHAPDGDVVPRTPNRPATGYVAPPPAPNPATTPELVSLEIRRTREQRLHCRLALRCDGRIVHGEAETLDGGRDTRLEAAARAAIAALNASGHTPALELEGARVCDIAGRAYATTALRMPHARGLRYLASAAPITDSAEDAAALAAVQAASPWYHDTTARLRNTATTV